MQPDRDTNSYAVTLLVNAPDDFSARPGMPVTVRIHHPSLVDTAWIVPGEALFERTGEVAHVWRIDPASQTLAKVTVEVGAEGDLRAGLNPGDQIVAALSLIHI